MKKIIFFSIFTLLTTPCGSHAMDKLTNFLTFILHDHPKTCQTSLITFPFHKLDKDLQPVIIENSYATPLTEVTQRITTFSQVNRAFHQNYNDRNNCLKVIKSLASDYNCSELAVALLLQTHQSKQRTSIQKELREGFRFHEDPAWFYERLVSKGADFAFTYNNHNPETLFVTAIKNERYDQIKFFINIKKNHPHVRLQQAHTAKTALEIAHTTGNAEIIKLIKNTL